MYQYKQMCKSKSSHPHCCQSTNNACKIPEHLNVTKLTILHNLAVYCEEGEMKISMYHRKEIFIYRLS